MACNKADEKIETKTSETSNNAVTDGKNLFYNVSEKTGLKCADCHNDGTNQENTNTKYFSNIIGANKRVSVFNGKITGEEIVNSAAGSTICWERYLGNKEPLTKEQINSLNAFFNSLIKGNESEQIKYTSIALPEPDKLKLKEIQKRVSELKGDKSRGESLYKETCSYCHNPDSKVKNAPSLFEDFEGNLKSITYHIRLGSKHMPFYSDEKISEQDIADITAFILGKKK